MGQLLVETLMYVIGSLVHNWLPLSLAILITAIMTVYIEPDKLKQILNKKSKVSIPASVTAGAVTPLCACGTMAVIIGMLTTALPWGPIMAFLTSSPLMSPDGFVLVAGIINLKFAIGLALASIIIGLISGYLTNLIEKTGFLKDQVRFKRGPEVSNNINEFATAKIQEQVKICKCPEPELISPDFKLKDFDFIPLKECCIQLCCDNSNSSRYNDNQFYFEFMLLSIAGNLAAKLVDFIRDLFFRLRKIKWHEIGNALINIGLKQIIFYYSIFAAIGFLINYFIPSSIIMVLFNAKNIFAVPLAALIGLPIYVNGESALPLIHTFIASGASSGAMLAFLITGPGTSAGVIAGIATILKKRAIILYILFLLLGAIILGYLFDLFLTTGI